ncbi:beta-lactamase/transpeptidase-like protein [Achaetomium macrosporum]|uniref:Beta-lactamase/transpeptidase-like protein n=1 Tax=Achaetomium macrosporum TaxID=79813 RepID=A0AAN7C0F7_9PEZI|nr:beta-lactamase/transpeptidase-like protein [Achaetomium macrosporum]
MGPFFLRTALIVGLASTLSYAQNCPLLGPAYPAATDVTSPAFVAAKTKFDEALASSAEVDKDRVWFAIEVYSSKSKDATPIYRHFNTPPAQNSSVTVGPDSVFRIHSISKVITVYAMLAKLSYKYWHEPVTKYIPELAGSPARDVVNDVDWSEVTLGSLAGQISGISRDYALGDASTVLPSVPGLRKLEDHEFVRCGSPPHAPCSRADAFKHILQTWPSALSYRTPNYSNMAFQILAYAVENITGMPFPDLVTEQLLKPLNLSRTYLYQPSDDTNAVVWDGWDIEFGEEAPMGGYYSSLNDLTTIGRSILNSTILSPLDTRQWLKPITHTSSLSFSMGSPWEIIRASVPVRTDAESASKTTSNVDFYTKQGGGDTYTSLLGLSPDHDVGVSILTAGPVSGATMIAIRELFVDIWLPAAEQAARDQAVINLVGNYTLGSEDDTATFSVAEVSIDPDEPAVFVSKLISNGTDVMALLRANTKSIVGDGEMRMWLYPMGLVSKSSGCKTRTAFRGVVGLAGKPAVDGCGSWAEGDRLRWGNYPADLVIFETGADGKAKGLEVPILGATLKRDGH